MALVFVSYMFKTFVKGAVTSIGGAVIFIGKGSLAVGGRSFETAEAGVNRHDLRR